MTVHLETFYKAIDPVVPDEGRGEWWTISRALQMVVRGELLSHYNVGQKTEFPRYASATPVEYALEFLGETSPSDLLTMVEQFYKDRGWLSCRLASRHVVRGDQRSAAAAVAWTEDIHSRLFRRDKVVVKILPHELLTDWLMREFGIARNDLADKLSHRIRKLNMDAARQ